MITRARIILALLLLPKLDHALSLSVRPHTRSSFHRPPSSSSSSSSSSPSSTPFSSRTLNNIISSPTISITRRQLHSSASGSSSINNDDRGIQSSETPLPVAMAVGVVASLVGYMYSKCMKAGFKLLWKTIPSALFGPGCSGSRLGNLLNMYPAAYIPTVITLGGGLVAALSTLYFPTLFSAHDYVHVLSEEDGANMDRFPSAREHLLPVMLLCCLTSVSGFSLGPEAPMVAAGGLVGVSGARMYLRSKDMSSSSSSSVEETLAYAGAAGTLTGFMNVPLAGPIFAMEMTSRRAGISPFAARSWSAAVAASLAGMAFVRGVLTPDLNVGGHFLYRAKAAVGAVTGRETILASLACGVGGAIVGTFFHKTLKFFKSVIWPPKSAAPSNNREKFATIGKKTLVALAVGMLSMFYPQTMFWGEGSLQCMIDGQCTPFSATPHGIPLMMTKLASVNPNQPFSSGLTALQVGMAKFMAIALASAGKFPGGVIFPLLSNGAMLSHAFISALRPLIPSTTSSLVVPLMTMSFMAATLTSITRTPLATVLILALTASGMTPLSALLPGVLMASYVSVWVSERLSSASFFNYSK